MEKIDTGGFVETFDTGGLVTKIRYGGGGLWKN